jgi:hypothetical protein
MNWEGRRRDVIVEHSLVVVVVVINAVGRMLIGGSDVMVTHLSDPNHFILPMLLVSVEVAHAKVKQRTRSHWKLAFRACIPGSAPPVFY